MEKYNYYAAVAEDVRDYITENAITLKDYEDADELKEYLQEQLWTHDSVTGNGSGSYIFNTWTAEEYLCHNWDLLQEAYEGFGYNGIPKNFTPEGADVTIRCYLLEGAIAEVVNELEGKEESND